MTKFEAIAKLERAVEQAEQLRSDGNAAPPFTRWRRDTLIAIKHIFGADSAHVSEFDRIGYAVVRTGGYSYSEFGEVLNPTPASAHREARQGGLGHAISVLQSMIAEIDEYWVNPDPQAQDGSAELPWPLVHPRIRDLARARFEAGHFADAVEAAFKEINTQVKQVVLARGDGEHDGANLMNKLALFTPNGLHKS